VLEILPTAGFNDQVTEVLLEPDTAAVNCCACPASRALDEGLTATVTGAVPPPVLPPPVLPPPEPPLPEPVEPVVPVPPVEGTSVTEAALTTVGMATLVAVMVIVVCVDIEEGAV
jgi:hypothetical protein